MKVCKKSGNKRPSKVLRIKGAEIRNTWTPPPPSSLPLFENAPLTVTVIINYQLPRNRTSETEDV